MAESDVAEMALRAIENARASGKIKKGTNEVTKAIERGTAKLVVVAKDANPPEIVMHIPVLAREKKVPFVEVASKEELGTAAGLPISTASVAVITIGDAKDVFKELEDRLKKENGRKNTGRAEAGRQGAE